MIHYTRKYRALLLPLVLFIILTACEDTTPNLHNPLPKPVSKHIDIPIESWKDSAYLLHSTISDSGTIRIDSQYAGKKLLYVFTNYSEKAVEFTSPAVQSNTASSAVHTDISHAHPHEQEEHTHVSNYWQAHDTVAAFTRAFEKQVQFADPQVFAANAHTDGLQVHNKNIGEHENFFVLSSNNKLEAKKLTLMAKQSTGKWTTFFWLDSAQTNIADISHKIQEMAYSFASPENPTNIFNMVTNVFGEPWGPHNRIDIAAPTDSNIHIMLYDIDSDGEPSPRAVRTNGFFYARDLFTKLPHGHTNAGKINGILMVHIDSAIFNIQDGNTWEITDRNPSNILSALAHELQHLIHFYQRTVRYGVWAGYDAWINEMNSMAAQDMIADKIHAILPRGTTKPFPKRQLINGRLVFYNAYGRHVSLPSWTLGRGVQTQYAVSYSFGVYLLRVFGGEVFQQIMQTVVGDRLHTFNTQFGGITGAVKKVSSQELTFAELVRRWGVAYLISDDPHAPKEYRLNNRGWFSSTVGQTSYKTGSINAHLYFPPPVITHASNPVKVASYANAFINAGTVPITGFQSYVDLPAKTSITVLTKRKKNDEAIH